MDKNELVENIKYIKNIITSSTEYTDLSGIASIISGTAAIAGSIYSLRITSDINTMDLSTTIILTWVWSIIFLVALVTNIYFIRKNARKIGQPAWSRLSKKIVEVLAPTIFMAGCFTLFCFYEQKTEWIPAIWIAMYGLSMWNASFFAIKEVRYLGILFIATGVITLFFLLEHSLVLLGISFGGYHLIYGVWLYCKYGK